VVFTHPVDINQSGFIIVDDDGWDADASAFEVDSRTIVDVGRTPQHYSYSYNGSNSWLAELLSFHMSNSHGNS
jgi:hypothetical protein